MDEETKRALERAGLQLVTAAEALREAGAILGGEIINLTPKPDVVGRDGIYDIKTAGEGRTHGEEK